MTEPERLATADYARMLEDEIEVLRADLRSATANYRKALDAKELLQTADQLRWKTWTEAIGDAAVGLMDKMHAFIDSDAMASAIYKFGKSSANRVDEVLTVDRSSLERMREWYNDSQAELQKTRNALGDLLARIELGECPLCGAIPAQTHQGGCPVPKALEIWDMLPDDSRRWAEARERWRNDPGYEDNEPSFTEYLINHGFEFEA